MGVILNTNYRVTDGNTNRVGWPRGEDGKTPWAYQRIARDAAAYRQAGFTAVQLPPFTKGGSGAYSDGYDKFDDYDIGSKNQCFSKPTAFGDAEMLRQCVASIHAHGMQAYGDLVLHQYGGGNDGVYKPLAADGVSATGRFPKHPSCFVGAAPRVPVDPVPDGQGNFAFGDMASYVNSTPRGYMRDGAIAAAGWLTRTTGIDGWRVDDVKGTNAGLVHDLLTSEALADKWAFGEYFDGNNGALWNWVNRDMGRRAGVLDFGFKFNAGNVCNNNTRVWMGQLANAGYCNVDPAMAVTFVESADTDSSLGEQVIWNKMLGYALLLTFPGYPSVYYRDWSDDPGCYGLKAPINNLIWIHETLANGDFVPRLDTDPQVFVHERTGWQDLPGCLCVFNNDRYHGYTRTVQTAFGANQELHEYTGNGPYNNHWTDGQGRLTFSVPPNNNGMSYMVFARPVASSGFGWRPVPTTQTFFGASDLDIPPLRDGVCEIGRVWCAEGTTLSAALQVARAGWSGESTARLAVLDAEGSVLAEKALPGEEALPDEEALPGEEALPSAGTAPGEQAALSLKIVRAGWHGLRVEAAGMPPEGSEFELEVRYVGGA